jgi:RNase P/RNase MRP subunit POP5
VKGTRRYRYILFYVTSTEQDQRVTFPELIQALQHYCMDIFSKNMKELGVWIVHFDGTTGILKCYYQEKEHAIALLQSLKNIDAKSIAITTHATSGTLQGLLGKKIPYPSKEKNHSR